MNAEDVTRIREERNMNKKQFAEALDKSPGLISKVERGEMKVSKDLERAINDYLEIERLNLESERLRWALKLKENPPT